MNLYLAVTTDELELPLFVTENLQEMADKYNVTKNNILASISHRRSGKYSRVKFVRIDIGESIWG